MNASNNTTQINNITEINENLTKNVDPLAQFRKYIREDIIGNIPIPDLMIYFTFMTLTGACIDWSCCDEVNKDLARKPKYNYNSDIINVLYYEMDLPITDRDYFIKTLLLREFEANQETRQLYRSYDNIHATLFVSGHQLTKKNIKFTQVGINEDNERHKYKTFAELLGTIRFIIEQTIGATVWIYINPNTLLPTIAVCKYNDKKRKWMFNEFITNFETNVSLGYVGVNMYNISSEDTVNAIKEQYNEFMKILNESISSQVNETANALPENKRLIRIHGDNIVVDNRFCFYYTISHKTISPLIRYIINYLNIDIPAFVNGNIKIKQSSINNYLKSVFCNLNPEIPGPTLNKDWWCDFGIVTDCQTQNDNRDKSMLLNCLPLTDLNRLNSFDVVTYWYCKGHPDILTNFVLSRFPSATYDNTIGLINVYNLLYDIISFDSILFNNLEGNREFKIWYLILHIYSNNYRKELMTTIRLSHYVKLMMLSLGASDYSTDINVEGILDTMLFYHQELTFEEAYKLVHPGLVRKNEYWSMILDLLRLIGPDFTNDELRSNKNLLFKMIDKECEC
jgi:hypothetical protein